MSGWIGASKKNSLESMAYNDNDRAIETARRINMPRVAIIGAGLIGRSWAIVFAQAGWDVALQDAAPGAAEAGLGPVAAGLSELSAAGLVTDAGAAAARVRAAASLADALDGASYVQENTPETVEAKQAI